VDLVEEDGHNTHNWIHEEWSNMVGYQISDWKETCYLLMGRASCL